MPKKTYRKAEQHHRTHTPALSACRPQPLCPRKHTETHNCTTEHTRLRSPHMVSGHHGRANGRGVQVRDGRPTLRLKPGGVAYRCARVDALISLSSGACGMRVCNSRVVIQACSKAICMYVAGGYIKKIKECGRRVGEHKRKKARPREKGPACACALHDHAHRKCLFKIKTRACSTRGCMFKGLSHA